MNSSGQSSFARRGYYLHACWEFNYPFAVRSWRRDDYRGMFELLRALDLNLVMLWPTTESIPAPMSDEDACDLRTFRDTIDDARSTGLETWLTQSANVTSDPGISAKPFHRRHLMPHARNVRLDDPVAREAYFKHRATVVSILNNADAYVTIDGDPGGYPGAQPEDFLRVLRADRQTLDHAGARPGRQRVVPWIWSGWGSDWKKNGPWNEPLEPLTMPLLEKLRTESIEPWEILPGRSAWENVSNGRTNIDLVERAGLIDRSILLLYEAIEFEPTQPATVIQFDIIRDVFRRERRHAQTARGVMGNGQQPIMSLPNLYFFARAARDLDVIEKSDAEVLNDFAAFLGGPPELLSTAWQSLRLELAELPEDIGSRLRDGSLRADVARHIPGGPGRYLNILAKMVETRRRVLSAAATTPRSSVDTANILAYATAAVVDWWRMTGYVFTGEAGCTFRWPFVHPAFCLPLSEFAAKYARGNRDVLDRAASILLDRGALDETEVGPRLDELVEGKTGASELWKFLSIFKPD